LVDWNAQAPWLTEVLSPNSTVSVQDLATREATLLEVGLKDADTGLRFMGQSLDGRRRFPPQVEQVRGMLDDLRHEYDVVVLDLPPMHGSSTAVRLSDVVDGFVLIARWGSTTQGLLSETLARTAAVDALFLGAVLTRCAPKRMRLYPSATRAPVARQPVAVPLDA
jgi:succinoglycan biosynthesis transport protein ExoP